jgi:hypothetical protein
MRFWTAVALSTALLGGETYAKHLPGQRRAVARVIPADNDPMPASLTITVDPMISGDETTSADRVTVSGNGLHAAFVIASGSRVAAVIDGKIGPKFDTIISNPSGNGSFIFSPDGTRSANLSITHKSGRR